MKLIFLGTGTSHGIPMPACTCAVCRSDDPRNVRRRSSLWVQDNGLSLIVDTPPDFREQALTFGITRVDAVFYTHAHADHVFGFDDIRRFSTLQNADIPVYAAPDTMQFLQHTFAYVMKTPLKGTTLPRIDFQTLETAVRIGPVTVTPLSVTHGDCPTRGFLFDHGTVRVAYIPDCREIPEETMEHLHDLDVMILDALRDRPHPTHLTVAQSVDWLQRIGAKQSFITHLCHEIDHAEVQSRLPSGIDCAYDGLGVRVDNIVLNPSSPVDAT